MSRSRLKSGGICTYCKKTYSKAGMTKHLSVCEQRRLFLEQQISKHPKKIFYLYITAHPIYWIHLEINAHDTLQILDAFLRDLWLECCGHLSQFIIGRQFFQSHPGEWEDNLSMKEKLIDVLQVGTKFRHEYDFGSTTELDIKVIAEREGQQLDQVIIMSQNNPYEWICSLCRREKATLICSQCYYEGNALLCAKCAIKHECDEEMYLPVVNSPRMGVCGYCG